MPGPGEAMWLPADQDLMAALLNLDAETCSSCGTRPDEWGTYDDNGVLMPFPTPPYEPRTTLCRGCEAKGSRDDKKRPWWVRVILVRRHRPGR